MGKRSLGTRLLSLLLVVVLVFSMSGMQSLAASVAQEIGDETGTTEQGVAIEQEAVSQPFAEESAEVEEAPEEPEEASYDQPSEGDPGPPPANQDHRMPKMEKHPAGACSMLITGPHSALWKTFKKCKN